MGVFFRSPLGDMSTRKPTSPLWKSISAGGGIIKGKWKISRKVGEGAFGEIYSAVNIITLQSVAIKFEMVDTKKQVLKIEVAVLRKLQGCPSIANLITCGRFNNYNFMVMELLGPNLSEYRRQSPTGKFSIVTTMRLGIQMLEAIQSMHDMGFLHRDIKPSNFAMGLPPNQNRCYIIDFGLARRYSMPNGEIRPEREQTGFRGTARYASIYSHQSRDLGRRDDLWSLFYLMVEGVVGELPWRRIKDKDHVGSVKMQHHTPELVAGLPSQFLDFMNYLKSLGFADEPDYGRLRRYFLEMLKEAGGDVTSPFDWEKAQSKNHIQRAVPSLKQLCQKQVLLNLEQYREGIAKKLPRSIKAELLQVILRVHAPNWPQQEYLSLLLDSQISELDLADHVLNQTTTATFAVTCTNLASLMLPSSTDQQVQEFVQPNLDTLENLRLQGGPTLTTKSFKYLERCYQLRSLHVQGADKLTDRHLETILHNCPYLKDLAVVDCKRVKGALFKVLTSKKPPITALSTIDLSLCPLSKKSFRAMTKFASRLTSITLKPLVTNFKVTLSDFQALIGEARSLVKLDVVTFAFDLDPLLVDISQNCVKLASLSIDGNGITDLGLQNVIQYSRSLRSLEFRYSENVTDTTLQRIARHLPEIRSLKIHFLSKFFRSSISEHAISNMINSCLQLNTLSMEKCLLLSQACFPDSLILSQLRELNLSDCVNLQDDDMNSILLCCPALEKLEINNLNQLSSQFLIQLSAAPKLTELFMLHCVNFEDEVVKELLNLLPHLFIHLTRFPTIDLTGCDFLVHVTNVDDILQAHPNTYKNKILERFRRSISNTSPINM